MAAEKSNALDVKFTNSAAGQYDVSSSQAGLADDDDGDENKERGNWSGKLDFLLSCLGYAVGLGNVWRFPYICGKNGGGAFLVPYIIMLTFVGLPIFFLELSIGQFSSRGPSMVWAVSPLFKGIGWGMMVISTLIGLEYNMIITWTFYYLFASFQAVLPWSNCNNEWNTPECFSDFNKQECLEKNESYYMRACHNDSELVVAFRDTNNPGLVKANLTEYYKRNSTQASNEYFNRRMLRLHESSGIGDLGAIQWDVCLCLLLAWITVFLCLIKGIKSSGKVVYFTATFPYLVLVILLVRGATLDGAIDGIKFYVTPQLDKLADPTIWSDAAGQIFFSLSCGMGGLMTLASYNRFHTNTLRDTLIVSIGNCATSVFAGFVIFSILGFMAKERGVPVSEVAASGTGLAFIAYPEAVVKMPVSPLWSIIFFFMLITLGLDSQFTMLETVSTGFMDVWPSLRKKKTWLMLAISVVAFFLGICMTTSGGIYVQYLMDSYAAGWSLIIVSLCEVLVVAWAYGIPSFSRDIEMMIGFKPNIFWTTCWRFITPVILVAILIYTFVDYQALEYGDTYIYPPWAQGIGWLMALASVIMIPIFAIYGIVRQQRLTGQSLVTCIRELVKPTWDWGPALDKHRTGDYKPLNVENATNGHSAVKYAANGQDNVAFDPSAPGV